MKKDKQPTQVRRIDKVKIAKETVEILYSVKRDDEKYDEFSIKTEQQPTPAFRKSLQDLTATASAIILQTQEFTDRLTISGVSLHYDDDGNRSAIITASKYLMEVKASFNFNTPLLPDVKPRGGFKGHVLPVGTADLLDEVVNQANKFLDGDRLQLELQEEDKA